MSQAILNDPSLRFLALGEGTARRNIAYIAHEGDKEPGIFWLSGFKSSMAGEKAAALARWAAKSGHGYTRMDYSGHGRSGGRFEDGTITRWLQEAEAVFNAAAAGPQILVGSSMGGWLALLLHRALCKTPERGNRIAGMVLIAPAWDMTETLMRERFSDEIKARIAADGFYARPSAYGDGDYVITKTLIEDGSRHLITGGALHAGVPVHILHGKEDPDVPWQHGQALMTLLAHDDVRFTLVPDGDHRLSRPQDIALLIRIIEEMAAASPPSRG